MIISGGQSGTDRAALDFALQHKISCGGWCPRGRMAEDGVIPDRYPLKESEIENPEHRTRKNVDESDGTLIIFQDEMDGGTLYTLQYAKKQLNPVCIIKKETGVNKSEFRLWMEINKIKVLNVAGPRESNSGGIYEFTLGVLEELFL